MPYHFMIWPGDSQEQASGELYGLNLSEDELLTRVIEPYRAGKPITWNGRSIANVSSIEIGFTNEDVIDPGGTGNRHDAFRSTQNVTNDLITGPHGGEAAKEASAVEEVSDSEPAQGEDATSALDPKRVMVVHGRNESARVAMFNFLRALGLQPIEWEAAIRETGMGTPHNFDAVRAAMDVAQAVVVVLTAEDQAGLLPALAEEGENTGLQGQPRQNVILEAGLAMGVGRERTILVELGPIRRASDFEGLNTVRMSNAPAKRTSLKSRLEGAGCVIDEPGADWLSPEAGGDFAACVMQWEETPAPQTIEETDEEGGDAPKTNASVDETEGRQGRARPAPENVSREEYQQARSTELHNKLYAFLDRRRVNDQPFSELELVDNMGDKKFDEVAALRLLRQLHADGVVYPNPDGSGWYPTEDLGGLQKQS